MFEAGIILYRNANVDIIKQKNKKFASKHTNSVTKVDVSFIKLQCVVAKIDKSIF